MKYEVADCIYTEEVYQFICIDYVSFGEAMDVRIPVSEAADPVTSGKSASKLYGNG